MTDSATVLFDTHRPDLLRVAYRMLGSMSDAEDVMQEAFIRWARADRGAVRVPAAFLRRIVTRLCLDHLKSARVRREAYGGPWLPEPVVEEHPVEDVTLPLMLALERLSPLERAAFLLHDVFGESFEDIAAAIGRDPAACRQLASRARTNVRKERTRYSVGREQGMEIAEAFFRASRGEGIAHLGKLLADDVRFHADGGGKRPAVARILEGAREVTRALAAILRLSHGPPQLIRYAFVNGLPGFVTREPDGMLQTTALLIEDGLIRTIYVMRNPDKLRHLEGSVH
ncbi:RNA polymerase, sigma-24 subunit, ECF subfamily [Sphingobium chlorophenolicum L-1]|uniref:RNA polymerase, sigma-24 subunit, ECF subfamily n=1 Tax=Sphingobium chlorophenolicum L-1 TaxID=690566 RepID=F6EZ65_SPHCR|nr:sigma-70 family RNA polymerase sigma factor [Sphingobium chlorophenolicum]AEG50158.1 RNA polymerase, sigma-24 subunit, ECF subfamily [Sphingobium chlorophenolicum L-1]